ncbi:MAG: hypothetical protein GY803_22315 [Chloroflexi bacterium]|nr:hypothetical protein [Chloroflexota bacterium]
MNKDEQYSVIDIETLNSLGPIITVSWPSSFRNIIFVFPSQKERTQAHEKARKTLAPDTVTICTAI